MSILAAKALRNELGPDIPNRAPSHPITPHDVTPVRPAAPLDNTGHMARRENLEKGTGNFARDRNRHLSNSQLAHELAPEFKEQPGSGSQQTRQ